MSDYLPQNRLEFAPHDFAAAPEAAMSAALRDMAYFGVGQLTGAFDAEIVKERFGIRPDESYVGSFQGRNFPISAGDELAGVVTALYKHITSPEQIRINAFVRHRNGSEPLHVDGAFPHLGEDSEAYTSGIRLAASIDGPESELIVVTNKKSVSTRVVRIGDQDYTSYETTPATRYVRAPYLRGAVFLLPESPSSPVSVRTNDEKVVQVQHPYHRGFQVDNGHLWEPESFRTLLVVDVKMLPGTEVSVDIPASKVLAHEYETERAI